MGLDGKCAPILAPILKDRAQTNGISMNVFVPLHWVDMETRLSKLGD